MRENAKDYGASPVARQTERDSPPPAADVLRTHFNPPACPCGGSWETVHPAKAKDYPSWASNEGNRYPRFIETDPPQIECRHRHRFDVVKFEHGRYVVGV
jgi:hypothetical protein